MKKILAILVISAFLSGSVPIIIANGAPDGEGNFYYYDALPEYRGDQPYHEGWWENHSTSVALQGSGSADPAIIKAKWETPDEDLTLPLSQIAPIPGGDKTVTYNAVVRKGTGTISDVWTEIYHPDGTYKYEVLLTPLSETVAAQEWQAITGTNVDCVTFNIPYFTALFNGVTPTVSQMVENILVELQQHDTLYRGSADLNYCQPAGWYTVGAIAHDNAYGWCDPLWNHFWYIPFAAFETDFTTVDWGTIQSGEVEWVDGDYSMDTPSAPTIRNLGNCPINFTINNTDMGFGYDGELNRWNVRFDSRLGHTLTPVEYDPFTNHSIIGGPIELCTEEKIDFSIHIYKPTQDTGTGYLHLTAFVDPDPWSMYYFTPEVFRGSEPGFMAQLTIPDLSPVGYAEPLPLPAWTDFP